ncbi:MAG: putative ABC transport system permease protein [Rhodothermales bacterium]|jgi:putative ABC transport system permease protein
MTLLSKEFSILVGVGLVIATPLTAFGMQKWLAAFPYHIGVDPLMFVWAGAFAMVIALGSVSYQALRVATADPVDSLRYE